LNRLSRAHERYRQTTDGRATANSERESEFTFAKNHDVVLAEAYLRTKWHLDPSSRLATIDIG